MHQAHLVLDTHTANALSLVKFIMRTSNDGGKSRQQKSLQRSYHIIITKF